MRRLLGRLLGTTRSVASLLGVTLLLGLTMTATAQTGDFRVENYATGGIQNNNFLWRGYVFRPSRDAVLTGLWGGGGTNCNAGFNAAIFEVTMTGGGTATVPQYTVGTMLRQVDMRAYAQNTESSTTALFAPFTQPLTVSTDQFYLIAQGRVSTGSMCHHATTQLDFENLTIGSAIIAEWYPQLDAAYQPSGSGTGAHLVNVTSNDTTPIRVLMGFRYESDVVDAELAVGVPAFVVQGTNVVVVESTLLNSGGSAPEDELTLYFEYATTSTFTTSTLVPADPFAVYGPQTNLPFGATLDTLTPGTTYYVRAVAINEAGRINGDHVSFTTDDLPVGFAVNAVVSGMGGSVTPATRVVQSGDTTTFVAQPDPGHALTSMTGCEGSLSGLTYTTGTITEACTVTATFSRFGEILTTDYGTTPITGTAFWWRGYSFQVSEITTVTHLVGGGQTATPSGFQGAIFSANTNAAGEATSPSSILTVVNFTGNTANQVVVLPEPITLQPDTWYYIAQGDTGGSPTVYHWYVESLDALDLVAASTRVTEWEPSAPGSDGSGTAHYWRSGAPESVVVGIEPTITTAKPALGFRYLTSATRPAVQTLEQPLAGRLTDRGGASTALYIEYGTNPTLSSGTTLNLVEASYEGPVPYDFVATASNLAPATTYYYRARAINDAGRVDGVIRSFTTPSPPGPPTITAVTPEGNQISVDITPPPEAFDTYQYSLDGGTTWTPRSPASSASPLVVTGLTIGATYDVVVRAVHEGTVGEPSNVVRVLWPQTIDFPAGAWQTNTYGDPPISLQATASSGLEVTFTSSDPDVVSTAGSTATITGAGTVTITASQPGNEAYAAAVPVQRELTVDPHAITVRADDVWRAYDEGDPDLLTFSVVEGALQYDDTPEAVFSGALQRVAGNELGTYAIEQGSLTANDNYDLTFLEGTFRIHHATPDHLRTVATDGPQVAGVAFDLVSVAAFDAYGHPADGQYGGTAYAGEKTLRYTLSGDDDGPTAGSDTFTTQVTFVDGVATTTLTTVLHRAQTTTISANDDTLPNVEDDVPSAPFVVLHAQADHLLFRTQPATTRSAVPFAEPPSVEVLDAYGNLATGFVGNVTFALIGATASLEPSGELAIPAASGIATLPCSWVDAPALGVQLHASSSGLASATSIAFDVTGALVSGVVYVDETAAGTRAPDAPPIEGARVGLAAAGDTVSWPDGGDLDGAACTPRSTDVAITDAQGHYRIPGLDAGTYELVVTGEPVEGMVRVGSDPFTIAAPAFGHYAGVDAGFFPGAFVEGVVFRDDGAGADGVANDAVRNGQEAGIGGVLVRGVTPEAEAAASSSAGGQYRLAVRLEDARAVIVSHDAGRATGHTLASGTEATTALAAGTVGHVALFEAIPGIVYQLDFGVVPPLRYSGAGEAVSGTPGVARFAVSVQPGTAGEVALVAEPSRYAWTPRLHPDDTHCSALTLSPDGPGEWRVSGEWPRETEDDRMAACRVQVDVHVPAGEPTGRVDDLLLRANLTWSRSEGAPVTSETSAPALLRTTVVEGGRVALTFDASSDGGLTYDERVEAAPGSPVRYRVRFVNPGSHAVQDVLVRLPVADAYTVPGGATALPAELRCPGAASAQSVELPYDALTRSLSLDLASAETCGLEQLAPGAGGELTLTLEIR